MLKFLLKRLQLWISDHKLGRCKSCGRIKFIQPAHSSVNREVIQLCRKCHQEMFRLFVYED